MEEQIVYYEDQVSVSVEDGEITKPDPDSDTESAVSSHRQFGIFSNVRSMVERVEEGNCDYEVVKRSFFTGMREFGKDINIVGIHKKNYSLSALDDARMEAFRVFAKAVACGNGGDANVKYGWYGGSRDEIRDILLYGFRRFENRSSSYGRGVYISPANIPIESVKTSVPDSDGLRHVLLCRVILGKAEQIPFGSQQKQPSSTDFNSGVDDLSSPKKYVIWEPYMNTHILPVYIISFQADSFIGSKSLRTPSSPHMSINGLMRQLTNHLSSSKMALIKRHHHEYQRNRLSKPAFIRNLRAIAGDDVLRAIVEGVR